jgi:hypothetical protein
MVDLWDGLSKERYAPLLWLSREEPSGIYQRSITIWHGKTALSVNARSIAHQAQEQLV